MSGRKEREKEHSERLAQCNKVKWRSEKESKKRESRERKQREQGERQMPETETRDRDRETG